MEEVFLGKQRQEQFCRVSNKDLLQNYLFGDINDFCVSFKGLNGERACVLAIWKHFFLIHFGY